MVLGIDLEKVYLCMGDTEGDVENPVLKAEQESQVGKGSRGDVTILPTLVVLLRATLEGNLFLLDSV